MLLKLGALTFELLPLNVTSYDHGHEASFAEKPVLGIMPPLEWVGEGGESWNLSAKLFPARFGGLDALQKLFQMRAAGQPQYFARGDGKAMGWVIIDKVSEKSSWLDPRGIGQVIDVDVSLRAASKPSDGSFYSVMQAVTSVLASGFSSTAINLG